MTHAFLATCPAGVGGYLAQELEGLGAQQILERPVGISFKGGLGLAYRACLWSRMANRIILLFYLENQVHLARGIFYANH